MQTRNLSISQGWSQVDLSEGTDLNTGVPSVSGHTQMQPWLAINYIIKY